MDEAQIQQEHKQWHPRTLASITAATLASITASTLASIIAATSNPSFAVTAFTSKRQ